VSARLVAAILEKARGNVVRAVNSNTVLAYWLIGREIVETIQEGEDPARLRQRGLRKEWAMAQARAVLTHVAGLLKFCPARIALNFLRAGSIWDDEGPPLRSGGKYSGVAHGVKARAGDGGGESIDPRPTGDIQDSDVRGDQASLARRHRGGVQSCIQRWARQQRRCTAAFAHAVEDERKEALPELGRDIAGDVRNRAEHELKHRNIEDVEISAEPTVLASAFQKPRGQRGDPVPRSLRAFAATPGAQDRIAQSAIGYMARGGFAQEELKPFPGIVGPERPFGKCSHLSDSLLEEHVDQAISVAEAPINGADADASAGRDLLQRRLDATRSKQLRRGGQDSLAVPLRVGAQGAPLSRRLLHW
jgi:hypothetical protein